MGCCTAAAAIPPRKRSSQTEESCLGVTAIRLNASADKKLGKSRRKKSGQLVVVQEELQQKKQIAGNTEVLLTADNLQQYVKKIEVDHKKNTYTEFVF